MFIKINHKTHGTIIIIVRDETELRLSKTCFRPESANCAGNFSMWRNARSVFENEGIVEALIIEAQKSLSEGSRTDSICIELSVGIGWSGTDDLEKYNLNDLEEFELNRKSQALRVKKTCVNLTSPITNSITLVYEVRKEDDKTSIIIHSMYPGKDIGELVGDITDREKCVFFDWNHPGITSSQRLDELMQQNPPLSGIGLAKALRKDGFNIDEVMTSLLDKGFVVQREEAKWGAILHISKKPVKAGMGAIRPLMGDSAEVAWQYN